jgi:hypothetical protein
MTAPRTTTPCRCGGRIESSGGFNPSSGESVYGGNCLRCGKGYGEALDDQPCPTCGGRGYHEAVRGLGGSMRVDCRDCAPLASATVRAEEPTGLCAGRLCDKRWGDGCPDVDPSLETYHLCYTAAGTPCRCSCGSAPPAAAEAADLTALAEAAEEVVCRYIGGSPLNGALGDAIDRLATALPTTRRDDT